MSYRRLLGSSNVSRYRHPTLCLCPVAAHSQKPHSSLSEVPVRVSPPAYLVTQKPAGFSGFSPPQRPSWPVIGSRFLNDDEETRNQKGFSVFPTRKGPAGDCQADCQREPPGPPQSTSTPQPHAHHQLANAPATTTHTNGEQVSRTLGGQPAQSCHLHQAVTREGTITTP